MLYEELSKMIKEIANNKATSAAYQGAINDDGGSSSLLNKLELFRNSIIFKEDLRPSEYYTINEMEVGNPIEFKDEIEKYLTKKFKNKLKFKG